MNNEFFQNNYSALSKNILQTIEQIDSNTFRNYLNNNSFYINKQFFNYLFYYCNKDNTFKTNCIMIKVEKMLYFI